MMRMSLSKRVVIVQRILSHYRKSFFEQLRAILVKRGVVLDLIYGMPDGKERLKRDTTDISWAHTIENRIIRCGSYKLCWQPCLRLLRGADLVIVEQASRLILNYFLLLAQFAGVTRLCFWGHGKNFQADSPNSVAEVLKRHMSRRVHWWFAYNDLSADVVKCLGYPEERITSVLNSIDTRELIAAKERVTQDDLDGLKNRIGIKGSNVCIFSGGMYKGKNMRFLIDACMLIRRKIPDFEMLFIGSGEDAHLVRSAAAAFDWIHYLGPILGAEKAPYFMMSKLLLMPGMVGLAILDSFVMETPLVTTNVHYHSPEISYLLTPEKRARTISESHGPEICYLHNSVNGSIVDNTTSLHIYTDEVVRLLMDDNARNELVKGCRESISMYSIEGMANRFAAGIEEALESGSISQRS